MAFLKNLILLLIFSSPLSVVGGINGDAMNFSLISYQDGNCKMFPCGHRLIYANGPISQTSASQLLRFYAGLSGEQRKGIYGVIFNSPGGNLWSGVEIGKSIRKLGLNSVVAGGVFGINLETGKRVFDEEAICASACAYAFLGGVVRSVVHGGKFGVHQFSGSLSEDHVQLSVAALHGYFNSMGVDLGLLQFASLMPPSGMLWLDRNQLFEWRVDNSGVTQESWRIHIDELG